MVQDPSYQSMTNLVSITGVVATDTTGVGTIRYGLAACSYGDDKGLWLVILVHTQIQQ